MQFLWNSKMIHGIPLNLIQSTETYQINKIKWNSIAYNALKCPTWIQLHRMNLMEFICSEEWNSIPLNEIQFTEWHQMEFNCTEWISNGTRPNITCSATTFDCYVFKRIFPQFIVKQLVGIGGIFESDQHYYI